MDSVTAKKFQISAAGTFYDISPNVLFRIKFPNVQHLFYTLFTPISLREKRKYPPQAKDIINSFRLNANNYHFRK